jgi:hypothetical protein
MERVKHKLTPSDFLTARCNNFNLVLQDIKPVKPEPVKSEPVKVERVKHKLTPADFLTVRCINFNLVLQGIKPVKSEPVKSEPVKVEQVKHKLTPADDGEDEGDFFWCGIPADFLRDEGDEDTEDTVIMDDDARDDSQSF